MSSAWSEFIERISSAFRAIHSRDDETLTGCFNRIATRYADRPALGSGAWQGSYRELDQASNRVAHAIAGRGGARGDRVAILMRHDSPLIVAMLAAIKAGRAVVVLNASDPVPRLQTVVRNAEPNLILTDDANRQLARDIAGEDCGILSCEDVPADAPERRLRIRINPDDTAFLIYTSGTTGEPKAVMQTHRYIVNNAIRHSRIMEFVPEDRLTLFASLSGAQGVSTAWSALAHGAALHPFPVIEKGVTGLAEWLNAQGITVYRSSASLFRSFMSTLDNRTTFPLMRVVRIASEKATSDDFRAFQAHFSDRCAFVHCLSSSETGNIAQFRLYRADAIPEGPLSTGHISDGVSVSLVDELGRGLKPSP